MTVITWNSCHKYDSIISQTDGHRYAKLFPLEHEFLCTIRYLEFGQILLKSLVSESVYSNYTMLMLRFTNYRRSMNYKYCCLGTNKRKYFVVPLSANE